MFRGWLLPVSAILLAGWLRHYLPPYTQENGFSIANTLLLAAAYLAIFAGMAAALGVTTGFIKSELEILKSAFLK
jgi:hypothetical protein